MNTSQNISTLLQSQLPEYIRSDPSYSNFVSFLQAYYEWMEQDSDTNNTNVLYNSKNILNYNDIDNTTEKFLEYYVNDFLQFFPKDSLVSPQLAIKAAKELYRSKGTPASYKFLFKILYNSDFDLFFTKDAILEASSGVWYIPKSVKLYTTDTAYLNIQNTRIFGETSKSIATVENSVLAGNKTEVFISNIERLFNSGEMVRIVDSNNQDIYFLNSQIVQKDQNGNYPVGAYNLRTKLVGQVSQINIDPQNRGLYYNPGDPVVVYGGLNQSVSNPIGATAHVGTTTSGSVKQIIPTTGGFGYTSNTLISISNAPGAIAIVGSLTAQLPPVPVISNPGSGYNVGDIVIKGNTQSYFAFADVSQVDENGSVTSIIYRNGLNANVILGITANVLSSNIFATNAAITISTVPGNGAANATYIVADTIDLKLQEPHLGHSSGIQLGSSASPIPYYFSKLPSANINSKLSDAFTFESFSTFAISSIFVENGGGGIASLPSIAAESIYPTDVYDPSDPTNALGNNITGNLANLGILSPIQIVNPGTGYQINDRIIFSGGSGYGANAIVSQVSPSGGITQIDFKYPNAGNIEYPLGGMGYKQSSLPVVVVNSSNVLASNAALLVPGILGSGATFSVSTDRIGSVTTIDLVTYGEDYISQPNVSLYIQDVVVSNTSTSDIIQSGDIVYQGISANNPSYVATVDSVSELTYNAIQESSLYNLRVFNYSSKINPALPLVVRNKPINLKLANTAFPLNTFYPGSPEYDVNGIKTYGDGNAKATSKFLNGLAIGAGQYLTSQGQLSSFSVLQNENYNNFTYQITVEAEISKYREMLLKLLHPSGMKIIGRYSIKSDVMNEITASDTLVFGHTLQYYSSSLLTTATMVADFINKSNNIISFSNLFGSGIIGIFANSIVEITSSAGDSIKSDVVSIDTTKNTITLKTNTWLTFSNVAYVSANVGSNTISVLSLTGSYDIINSGNYTNSSYPLMDIVRAGDKILIPNNTVKIVSGVDYINNNIILTSNLTNAANNSLLSVNRTFVATSPYIKIYSSTGIPVFLEITDQSGNSITTQDGLIITA